MRLRSAFAVIVSILPLLAQPSAKAPTSQERRRPVPGYDARLAASGGRVVMLSVKPTESARAATSGAGNPAEASRRLLLEQSNQVGLPAEVARQLKLVTQTETSAAFQETISGIPVFEGYVKVSLNRAGDPISVALPANAPTRLNRALAALSPQDAIKRAFAVLHLSEPGELKARETGAVFENPLGAGHDPVEVELTAFPVDPESGAARLAWHVHLDGGSGRRAEVVIDAVNGQLLFCHSLERYAGNARVWKVAPDKGDRAQVNFPESWLTNGQTSTNANNVDAYLDTDGNDQPDTLVETGIRSGRAFAENQSFEFPAPDPNGQDDPRKFRAAAVTNAFYHANAAHDYFYGLGFDEEAGNFQVSNGTKGGRGGDAVRVEVQDRFETNNASMTLTRDGAAPRLSLGIFTRGTTTFTDDRDFAYDGQTITHEYAHGVTNRNVGGAAATSCLIGKQSGALDEGWADYFATSYFNDPIQSSFLASNNRGIRRRSYEGYPFTYEDLGNDGFEAHRDGEIWAATLWDLRKALGQTLADKLVYSALRGTPCRPTFVAARDAILAADEALNNRANRARIWETFARHGLGASATGLDGGGFAATVFTAAFDLPADLSTTNNRAPAITSQPPDVASGGTLFSYQIRASDSDGGTLRYELLQGPTGMTVDAATGLVRWNAGFLGSRAKVLVTDGQGGRLIHGFEITVVTPLRPGVPATIAIPTRGESALVSIDVPANTPVLQLASRGGTGDVDIDLIGPNGEFQFTDYRSGSFETMSVGNPAPGRWLGLIYAYREFEGAAITATLPVPRLIKATDTLTGLNGEVSSETFYRVIVPQGATSLTVKTEGGSGDVDLFVDREIPPVCQSYDEDLSIRCFYFRRSANFRNNETIQLEAPQPGNWYLNLSSASGYAAVTLTTAMVVRPLLVVDPLTVTFNALEGGPAPAAQVVKIADPSGSAFAWTATVNPAAAWLKLSTDKGAGDSDLALSVSSQGLTPGTYRTSISISGAGLGNTPQTVNVIFNYTRPATIVPTARQFAFTSPAGKDPTPQGLEFNNGGGASSSFEWSITAATRTGGNWLSVDQPRGTGNGRVQIIVRAGALTPGAYDGTLTLSATGAPNATVDIRYVVTQGMSLIEESLRGAAAQLPGRAVSPGDLLIVQGANLIDACTGAACPTAAGYPLPVELGGLQIRVNGQAAPLVSVSPTEARFIVPFDVTGGEVRIEAARGGASTTAIVRPLEAQSIGIFTVLDNGAGAGRLLHADGTLVSRAAPLAAEETISILVGGLGLVSPAVTSGAAAPADPLAQALVPTQVYFDGREGTVESAYLEPGVAGRYLVRVKVPAGLNRIFPLVQVQSALSQSPEVSAGGPSLASASRVIAKGSGDAEITLQGLDLPAGAAVKIGEESFPASTGTATEVTFTLPARLLANAQDLLLSVIDPAAPAEAPSNIVTVSVR